MRVIGLVGDVCAGKSAVAAVFREKGAEVWDADDYVHRLYARADVRQELREQLGLEVFGEDGKVDRKKLAARVFREPAALKLLTEKIVWPRTRRALQARLRAARRRLAPALVLDAPTLLESGSDRFCAVVIYVRAPRASRVRWAQETRGWEAAELDRRQANLGNQAQRLARGDIVLDNDGDLPALRRRAAQIWEELIR